MCLPFWTKRTFPDEVRYSTPCPRHTIIKWECVFHAQVILLKPDLSENIREICPKIVASMNSVRSTCEDAAKKLLQQKDENSFTGLAGSYQLFWQLPSLPLAESMPWFLFCPTSWYALLQANNFQSWSNVERIEASFLWTYIKLWLAAFHHMYSPKYTFEFDAAVGQISCFREVGRCKSHRGCTLSLSINCLNAINSAWNPLFQEIWILIYFASQIL